MLRKMFMSSCVAALMLGNVSFAQEAQGNGFRAAEEGNWYHPVEPEQWVYMGADEAVVHGVLTRIAQAEGARLNEDQPDTLIEYGPGHWTYEFVQAGDDAVLEENYEAAIVYYHLAAAPHTGTVEQTAALEKARASYAGAMADVGFYEEVSISVDDKSFIAHLHLPEGEGPKPVLILSNGSDMSSVTTLGFYKKHLKPRGIGFLTIDLPGLGRSAEFDIKDGRSEKLLVATAKWAKGDPRIASENIFVQGVSFAGHSVARLFTLHQNLELGGVVYACGPLSGAFLAPPEAYAQFPKFTIDGVKTRLGMNIDADLETFAEAVRVFSVHDKGVFDGDPIDTPILALNTNNDPSAPVEELDMLLKRATNAERIIFDMPGHCPPHHHREPLIAAWIQEHLR